MNKETKQEIFKDIQRAIPNIARRNGVKEEDVKAVLSEVFTPANAYVFIPWPDVQEYMEYEGFSENSTLCNDDETLEEYGSQCYFVDLQWINSIEEI